MDFQYNSVVVLNSACLLFGSIPVLSVDIFVFFVNSLVFLSIHLSFCQYTCRTVFLSIIHLSICQHTCLFFQYTCIVYQYSFLSVNILVLFVNTLVFLSIQLSYLAVFLLVCRYTRGVILYWYGRKFYGSRSDTSLLNEVDIRQGFGPLKAPRNFSINGAKSCILSLSWNLNFSHEIWGVE